VSCVDPTGGESLILGAYKRNGFGQLFGVAGRSPSVNTG